MLWSSNVKIRVRRTNCMGWVYFIRCDLAPAVKIGWAFNPLSRLAELQIGVPVDLKIVTAKPGSLRTEQALHRDLAPLRLRGEWFKTEGAVLQLMEATLKEYGPTPWAPPPPPDPFAFHHLRRLMTFESEKWVKPAPWTP